MGWVGVALSLVIAVRTASYGCWAWGKKYYLGAVGIWIISLVTVALPVAVLLLK